MKRIFFGFCIALVACGSQPGELTQHGAFAMAGKWRAEKGKNALGQMEYIDLDLTAEGNGYLGEGLRAGDKEGYLPFLSFNIEHWLFSEDTLTVSGEVDAGQASENDEIRQELLGIRIEKIFVVTETGPDWFKARPYDPDDNLIHLAGESQEGEVLVFRKR
ncbi:MAG: hypothetical protein KDD36_05785 [Flavobacteriales bacterium]|nr:hypothetical protein [Flavobacteriales bacterium]